MSTGETSGSLERQLELSEEYRGHDIELWLDPIREEPGPVGTKNYEYRLYIDGDELITGSEFKDMSWHGGRAFHLNMKDYARAFIDGMEGDAR